MVKTSQEENRENNPLFSEETIQSLTELGDVLRKIHMRILSEGYIFKDNQFMLPHEQTGNKNKSSN